MPPVAIEDARRQRQVTFAEQLAANIERRYAEAQLAEVSSVPDLRILDPATTPLRPLYNLAPALVVVGFLGSLGVGVFSALALDRSDPRFRYPDQVTKVMGLPILGVVPHVKPGRGDGEEAGVIEAVRGVRLNVVHAHGTGPVLVSITSPGRGDGKSFLAANLALALAEALPHLLDVGGRVEVVAFDQRQRKRLRQAPADLGLAAAGHAHHHDVPRIAHGVSSAAMPRLIGQLRPSYEAIIVDSPPLAAGVDAFVLGTVTGTLVLVLRTGRSDRDLAQAKLDVLDRLPVRLLGAVINDVRWGSDYRYYSYYLPGYELTDEDEAREPARSLLRAPE